MILNLPYSDELDIQHLSRLFDNMSECYKLFWFQAIVDAVIDGKEKASYDELINQMAADTWYMVSEYKLNLGPKDTLEDLVHYAYKSSGLKSSEKSAKVLVFLQNSSDKELIQKKSVLTLHVPYRLQAPFMPDFKGAAWDGGSADIAARINKHQRLLYYFIMISGLQSEIQFDKRWMDYIRANQEIIKGWIQFNIILYLQRRNPSVPGIANKIYPPDERNLERVKKYWKLIITLSPTHDIYGGIELTTNDISIDHFVPWSYVAHDELWNLCPTTRNINSSKRNSLPDWRMYFHRLGEIEYEAYKMVQQYDSVQKEFDKCAKEHVNNPDVLNKLYRPGLSKSVFIRNLKEIIEPVYTAASNMGFEFWRLSQ
jgi:hypothetical protein